MITVISVVETKGLSMDELEELSSTAARQLKDRTSAATDVTRFGELIKRHGRSPYTSWKIIVRSNSHLGAAFYAAAERFRTHRKFRSAPAGPQLN